MKFFTHIKSLEVFFHDSLTNISDEETFLQDFLVNMKRTLSRIFFKTCCIGTICKAMSAAYVKIFDHTIECYRRTQVILHQLLDHRKIPKINTF